MDYNELLDMLEIESPDEFGYFEHFASLIECDEDIPYDLFYRFLSETDSETLIDLTDNYFEDILQGIPDDGIEIYTMLDTIRQALLGLLSNSSNSDDDRIAYVDELYKFRNWYIFDGIVHVQRINDGKEFDVSISEAISLYRLEKLNEDKYRYDFSDCLDYEIDEYSISFDAKIDEEYDEIIEEDEELYEEGLIDKEFPVIDGESYDEEADADY
ncbi:MAG: hypothetical protein ACOX4V_09190 [Anaerovoracaceae bacterium]|jgi:hypothetical protein|nr:hypothetical protein [Clostridiales bacterium]